MTTLQQLTLLVCVLIQTIVYSQTTPLEPFTEKYNTLLNDQDQGIALLLKKGDITATASLGKHNLTANSVFNIGSATKTFTAILILQEVEKGKLKLSDAIGDYLSPIPNVDATLTIEDLLTHESGLDEVIGENILELFFGKDGARYDINLLNEIEENHPEMIGQFDYCNTNYFLLGRIIEKVTDQSYFDLLRERIITPAQMKSTHPYVHKNLPNLATPRHDGKEVSEFLDYRFFADIAFAAGSMASTLTDMEQFYTTLFETEVLLQKETVELMMSSGNEFYGLGIQKLTEDGITYFGHGGNNIGYAFRNHYNPANKDLYLMFSNNMGIPLKDAIKTDLLASLNNQDIAQFSSVDIDLFKAYTGSYLLKEANLTLEIVIEETKMYLIVEAQGVKSELTQKSDTSLYDTVVGVILSKVDDDPNVLTFNQNGFVTTIARVDSNTAPQN